jgi:hypothetical protein
MELKALVDDKGIYSFDKAYLGSYKDYIPDYYQLGYQMVSNIRNQYGQRVWSKVLHHIARNPLTFNALSKGLLLATGKDQDEHYLNIMNNLKNTNPFRFAIQDDTVNIDQSMVKPSRIYTSYRYPFFTGDSSIVALKSSLQEIPRFVLIDSHQQEQLLFVPGTILDESVNFSNGKLVWIESKPDPRWTHKERSLLRILDIHSGKLWEKTFDNKLFAPAITPDGKKIALVKYDDQNLSSIVQLSTGNGQIIRELKATGYNSFLTPSWSADQSVLYAITLDKNGKSIVRINSDTGEAVRITSSTFGGIQKPVQCNNYLFYSSDFAGKNEGYALDLLSNKNYRVVTAKYGIKDLQTSGDGSNIIYADYTANGFKIKQKKLFQGKLMEMDSAHWFVDTLSNKLTAQEKGIINFSRLDTNRFSSSKYFKIKNLINIHSWSPVYIDPDQSVVNTGFSIISQNKLTTAITQLGYDYSTVNHTGKWVGKFEFDGWYPVMRLYGDYGKENSSYYQINRHYNSKNTLISQDTVSVPYTQTVMNLRVDGAIPLDFTRGKMFRLFQPEIQIGYTYRWQSAATPSTIFRGSYIPFTYRLYAHNLRQQSVRDIQPGWGQAVNLQFRHTPFGDKELGKIVSIEGTLYLPGIIKNQGIKFYGGYQRKISGNSYFNDLIYYPRGYVNTDNNKLLTLRSDYVLTLLAPDWHLWKLYYLKRVTLRIHYDYARMESPIHPSGSVLKTMSSTGAELLTECHFLRFIAPVKIGVRESYLNESKNVTSEFILSVNLKGM